MNELTRILRYILPGLSAVMQLIVALSITEKCFFRSLLENQNAGGMFGVFLASGALGYIFSNIYFPIYWWKYTVDYRDIFRNLQNKIDLKDGQGNVINNLKKFEAYSIVDQYWHSNLENNMIKGVTSCAERLNDIMHGLGANIVGSILAFLTWFVLTLLNGDWKCIYLLLIVFWVLLIWFFYLSYKQTKTKQQSVVNSTMTAFIEQEFSKKRVGKVQIYYVK